MNPKRMIRQAPEEELRVFFEELKDFHLKEKHEFVWDWGQMLKNTKEQGETRDFVYYIAYNLSKNILHGPLPSSLHSRMVFDTNVWSKRYFDYLEGK
jgi:hypothetical protein